MVIVKYILLDSISAINLANLQTQEIFLKKQKKKN